MRPTVFPPCEAWRPGRCLFLFTMVPFAHETQSLMLFMLLATCIDTQMNFLIQSLGEKGTIFAGLDQLLLQQLAECPANLEVLLAAHLARLALQDRVGVPACTAASSEPSRQR